MGWDKLPKGMVVGDWFLVFGGYWFKVALTERHFMSSMEPAMMVAEGVYQVRIPLPFALNIVNCYLLRDGDGWTVLDTGLNTPPAQEAWKAAFAFLKITPEQIKRIILTHSHPDHYGMAGWFQSLRGGGSVPPVYLSAVEQEWANIVWRKIAPPRMEFDQYLAACGLTGEMLETVAHSMDSTTEKTHPHPTDERLLEPGETVQIGMRTFTIYHAPGHSDGQLIFYDANDRLLLSGDHVLLKITPNIGLWPDTLPDPLGRYLDSLKQLLALEVRLALPGHKTLITDWRGRLNELIEHHAIRLSHTLEAVKNEATVYEASLKVFNSGAFSSHEWRFAMAETLAHLEYLRLRGQVEQETRDGVWGFRAS
jgi:glyoxylase-like metal-dependent hydrolase (beta-lactamase superfamily II)